MRILANLFSFGGIVLIVVILVVLVLQLVVGVGVKLDHFPEYLILGFPLLLVGQLVQWALSMWELSVEKRNLLRKLLSEVEHNKSLNADASDAGAG